MRNIAARDAKNRFGELLDMAQREPVTIEKYGRAVAVMVSAQEYGELEAMKLARLKAELQTGIDDLDADRSVDGETFFAGMMDKDGG